MCCSYYRALFIVLSIYFILFYFDLYCFSSPFPMPGPFPFEPNPTKAHCLGMLTIPANDELPD